MLASYLTQRGRRFHLRLRIPSDLVAQFLSMTGKSLYGPSIGGATPEANEHASEPTSKNREHAGLGNGCCTNAHFAAIR
jgi:hypothetical protein